MPHENVKKIVYQSGSRELVTDKVILEQPLQIRLFWYDELAMSHSQIFTITMRTPGKDNVLILGLLLSEGVIRSIDDIEQLSIEKTESDESGVNQGQQKKQLNLWEVTLAKGIIPKLSSLERYQVTYSSCGLCGATSLKALELKNPKQLCQKKSWLAVDDVHLMPERMKVQQKDFIETGGVHAAALFNKNGQLIDLYEDIGRHNALDKLFGYLLQQSQQQPSLQQRDQLIAVVSGRVSFEIVQKVVMAGISVLIAVGAPSDLAIKAAKRFDLTLIGFASRQSFNLYYGEWRLAANASNENINNKNKNTNQSLEQSCQKT